MSELRQDLVCGDWIILSTERAKRPVSLRGKPHELIKKSVSQRRKPTPIGDCPFEDLKKSGNWPPVEMQPNEKDWKVAVIPNKYPALRHSNNCAVPFKTGPYKLFGGIGHHELVVTRDHKKNLAHSTKKEGVEIFEVIQKRYRELKKDNCMVYTSTFFNWGQSAGASLYHPHYQMITLPIIPPNINHSLNGSANYFKKHRRCVHCEIVKFEEDNKKRIIAKNSAAIAVAPFVSRQPFEIRIFPRQHQPYFENTPIARLKGIVSVLQTALRKVEKNLRDPDLNFFIHTSPLKNQARYKHYHWHMEIVPKISTLAGFELGTGVDINVVDPDAAAAILRK